MREPSSTEGYLLISVWSIFGDSDYEPPCGELEFMEEVMRAIRTAVFTLDTWIDWDEMTTVFDYEYADDVTDGSLARVIFNAVVSEDEDIDTPVFSWLHRSKLPLIQSE